MHSLSACRLQPADEQVVSNRGAFFAADQIVIIALTSVWNQPGNDIISRFF
jgi:hypothetical protein